MTLDDEALDELGPDRDDRDVVRCDNCGEQHDRVRGGCPFCGHNGARA